MRLPQNEDQMQSWRPSRKQRRVLLALLSGAANLGGLTIAQTAQAGAGATCVLLARLERMGHVTTSLEKVPPEERRRPRRFYRLTPCGHEMAMGKLRLKEEAADAPPR